MSEQHTPTPAHYGVRRDGSVWMSFGVHGKGEHCQFDFLGSKEMAADITSRVNAYGELVAALEIIGSGNTFNSAAYARARLMEHNTARAALAFAKAEPSS